jgi:hypothetical protein
MRFDPSVVFESNLIDIVGAGKGRIVSDSSRVHWIFASPAAGIEPTP